ncbi:DUF4395 domain-containing protein [Gulosibacter molinativorax]|uniref:DUF4395 domain-containing protein n=1 Tax=Gulosibacter molinativorax TaxID=256821 RepID=A0ABT7CBM7_9MICO|nr:DUF4395 domain-containing protein [Gulosibacter molinativorax]MDJ1372605.1 DUF4395 domain-containing protein [Gulosibacter molinativorax]QUY62267.1 Unknown protein [Gulosibacter molinativorax]
MPGQSPVTETETSPESPTIGQYVAGYEIPVIDERAVRAAAGILFLLGGAAFATAAFTGSTQPLQPFGMFFMIDMLTRVVAGDRWSPTMALGRLAVRGQQPEWVGAPQKKFAWWLGFGLAAVSCGGMGFLAAPLAVTLALCGLCLTLLFLETAFGICVGCLLQARFGKQAPMYCPGGKCAVGTGR